MSELVRAFLVGGVLCAIAQSLIDCTALTPARSLVSYVCAGVFLGAIGLYKPIVEFAGCGATVPLTGFGYRMAEGVRRAVAADGWLGILSGGFTAASAGITAALTGGLLCALIFRSKPKR